MNRRGFIGGSDARIILGRDENALIRLWQEKRGECEPEDLSNNLIVQLGNATEDLNRQWFERNSGTTLEKVQARVRHCSLDWMAATLDGMVKESGAVFEAKFMLPWSFSEEAAVAKHTAQLQHNMLVTGARTSVLSIITGGGKWVELRINADPMYQTVLVAVEKAFWRAVQTGELPSLYDAEAPRPRLAAIRIVDMSTSNAWAEFSGIYARTRAAHAEHERAKSELKMLVPEDAREATGHRVRARRSRAGAISFDLLEAPDAPL